LKGINKGTEIVPVEWKDGKKPLKELKRIKKKYGCRNAYKYGKNGDG
jgi:hypothetical protein